MPDRINIPAWDNVRCSRCGEYRPKGNGEKWSGRRCPECALQTRREYRWTARGHKYNAICKEGPECFIKAVAAMPRVCNRCGSTEGIVPDHDIPLILRGPHCGLNVVPLCGKCNSSKGGSVADADGNRCYPPEFPTPESRSQWFEQLISEPLIDLHSRQDKSQASEPKDRASTRQELTPQPIITRRVGMPLPPMHWGIAPYPYHRGIHENPDQWEVKMPGSNRIYLVSKFAGQWGCDCHKCLGRRCEHITAVLKYLRANGYEPE